MFVGVLVVVLVLVLVVQILEPGPGRAAEDGTPERVWPVPLRTAARRIVERWK